VAVVDAEVAVTASDATTVAIVATVVTEVIVVQTVAVIGSAAELEVRDLSWITKRRNQRG
jgi:hypothetical protein